MEHDTYILEQAAEIVYSRPEQHGEPEDTFDEIAGAWSWYLGVDVSEIDAAIMFILMKIARSKNGHYDEDNPADVAGYAENWARLEEEKSTIRNVTNVIPRIKRRARRLRVRFLRREPIPTNCVRLKSLALLGKEGERDA